MPGELYFGHGVTKVKTQNHTLTYSLIKINLQALPALKVGYNFNRLDDAIRFLNPDNTLPSYASVVKIHNE